MSGVDTGTGLHFVRTGRPGSLILTAINKSEGSVHASGSRPFVRQYFSLVLSLRKHISAVHAQEYCQAPRCRS